MSVTGGGLVGPGNFPVRDPKARPMNVGRIKNPRGKDMELGGNVKWPGNSFDVQKPTRVDATVRTAD